MPAKLNTVIQPLVGGLRREGDAVVREAVAAAVAHLVILCTDRNPSQMTGKALVLTIIVLQSLKHLLPYDRHVSISDRSQRVKQGGLWLSAVCGFFRSEMLPAGSQEISAQ